jgi:lipoic acid synthetase
MNDLSAAPRPERQRKPDWIRVKAPVSKGFQETRALMRELSLNTVCEEAACPNIGECWSKKHATVMILGDVCTRACAFCNVKTGMPRKVDPLEPEHVAIAAAKLGLEHIVVTSVDRDDLPDGGSAHYASCIAEIRARAPRTVVETLIPDYQARDLATLMAAAPDVLAHNVEVVERLQRKIRDPRCSFERSLETLRGAKRELPGVITKSSLMLGLGETHGEVVEAMQRLRDAGVELLTLGQYLRPTPQHAPVREWVTPERFLDLQMLGEKLGFLYVASGPLVRSSYKAGEFFAAKLVRERRAVRS